jgi:hypothetical protein
VRGLCAVFSACDLRDGSTSDLFCGGCSFSVLRHPGAWHAERGCSGRAAKPATRTPRAPMVGVSAESRYSGAVAPDPGQDAAASGRRAAHETGARTGSLQRRLFVVRLEGRPCNCACRGSSGRFDRRGDAAHQRSRGPAFSLAGLWRRQSGTWASSSTITETLGVAIRARRLAGAEGAG